MAERTCYNCVYCCCDPGLWLRLMEAGEPILPRCANHPQWPGQLHEVPGVPCRNYRPRPALPQGDDVRMIPLSDGCYAYVDGADYAWLRRWHWDLINGYPARREKGKTIFMHRLILPPPRGMLVDHIDGSRVNNCRRNLRVCTRAQNICNTRKRSDSSSVFKGVFYNRQRRKWFAKCRYKGQYHRRGYFDTEIEAARAYDRLALEWFGEFARLNFPQEWPPERRTQVYAQRHEPDVKTKVRRSEGKKGRGKKPHAKRNASGAKRKTPAAQDATLTAERKTLAAQCTTKSARATAPKPQRKGKTKNRKAEGRRAPPP